MSQNWHHVLSFSRRGRRTRVLICYSERSELARSRQHKQSWGGGGAPSRYHRWQQAFVVCASFAACFASSAAAADRHVLRCGCGLPPRWRPAAARQMDLWSEADFTQILCCLCRIHFLILRRFYAAYTEFMPNLCIFAKFMQFICPICKKHAKNMHHIMHNMQKNSKICKKWRPAKCKIWKIKNAKMHNL